MSSTDMPFFIRCRAPGMKRSELLKPNGHLTRRRVFAALIPVERVDGCLMELRQMNPDWTFSAVKAYRCSLSTPRRLRTNDRPH